MSTRHERRAQRRKQRGGAGARERTFPWFTLLVVAVVLVGGYFALRAFGAFEPQTTAIAGPSIDPRQFETQKAGERVPIMGNAHIPTGQRFTSYNSTPPTSGPHWNERGKAPIAWAAYTSQQPDEAVVHNLEHGGVLIAYNGISGDDVANLRSLRTRYPRDKYGEVKIVIEPYDRLEPGTIALAAWGWIDKLQSYDERRIISFLAAHIGQGPEDAP